MSKTGTFQEHCMTIQCSCGKHVPFYNGKLLGYPFATICRLCCVRVCEECITYFDKVTKISNGFVFCRECSDKELVICKLCGCACELLLMENGEDSLGISKYVCKLCCANICKTCSERCCIIQDGKKIYYCGNCK